jgi:hypothetical protein
LGKKTRISAEELLRLSERALAEEKSIGPIKSARFIGLFNNQPWPELIVGHNVGFE